MISRMLKVLTCFTSSNFWENILISYIQWNVLIFIENDLISPNQSGLKQGHSCINQLLSIIHDIYQSLDQGYEICGVFLDI